MIIRKVSLLFALLKSTLHNRNGATVGWVHVCAWCANLDNQEVHIRQRTMAGSTNFFV